jgi:hypothetical protein
MRRICMTAKEAIEEFTGDDDHERNHRDCPLLAKAFDEIRGSYAIPAPFHKWLIALGCPDDGGQMLEAATVTSSLLVGLLECARTHWGDDDPEWHSGWMRELICFAEPVEEQIHRMRQAIAAIEEELEPSASTESTAAVESPAS